MSVRIRAYFETNSSSSHSLVLVTGNALRSLNDLGTYTLINDEIHFLVNEGDYEFGWTITVYNDPPTKATFLYLSASDELRERLLRIIAHYTRADHVAFHREVNTEGYIDHQSQRVGVDFMMQHSDEDIWELIMGDSVLRCGNDNEFLPWNELVEIGS